MVDDRSLSRLCWCLASGGPNLSQCTVAGETLGQCSGKHQALFLLGWAQHIADIRVRAGGDLRTFHPLVEALAQWPADPYLLGILAELGEELVALSKQHVAEVDARWMERTRKDSTP
jgi:hypothetical protein